MLAISLTVLLANAVASPPQGDPPKATLADVAWIAGQWRGKGLGGEVEEVWSPPLGDNMLGMFKLVKDGKTSFCELLCISQKGDSLIIRIKHFDARLRGWEEKDQAEEYPLTKLGERRAEFGRLVFERPEDDRLRITVVETERPSLVFEFRARSK